MEFLNAAKKIIRRMNLLAISIALFIVVAIPFTYLYLELQDEKERGIFHAQKYALKFQRTIMENPKYWKFNLEKFIEVFSDIQGENWIEAIEVYDTDMSLLHREKLLEPSLFTIHQIAEIHYNNKLYGFVIIYSSLWHFIRNAIVLVCLFVIVGVIVLKYVWEANSLLRQLAEANGHLKRLSIIDGKTGLLNATISIEKLKIEIQKNFQTGSGLCLLFVDIDHFKKYNDLYGHIEGDAILIQLAELLKATVRQMDIIGRFGGEEFIIILPSTMEEEGIGVAESILNMVNQADFQGEEYMPKGKLTVSIGLAYTADGIITARELMKRADKALYWAKETGRNNIKRYCEEKVLIEVPVKLHMAEIYPVMKQEITNKVLDKFIENLKQDMYDVYEPTVRSLLKALEMWEIQTVQHSLRVNRIAMVVGKELGLSPKELSNLNLGTLLHDIGKLSIGDSILLKEAALTPEEYRLMQNHPQAGFNIVMDNELLNDASKVILYHHERFDGKGYPNGIKGDEIPLLARICSVADAFDAMSSGRPYKKSISLVDVRKEIVRCSGSQFDPQVVESFLKISDDKLE
ncbi:diguanylate cyclase [Pelosinus sp. sgz500959]|uniref:bifunctional diguanylate cyclase/phosphohydrolase n=1 Tax=Pelosinus sp. sgz500959 TaxID=3242472 RepID=UPI00366B4CB5